LFKDFLFIEMLLLSFILKSQIEFCDFFFI